MERAIHDHFSAYGRTRGFVTTHTRLSEGGSGPAVPRISTSIAMIFVVVSRRTHPHANITRYFSMVGKRAQHKPNRYSSSKISILPKILGAPLASRPGVLRGIMIGSHLGATEMASGAQSNGKQRYVSVFMRGNMNRQ